MSGLVRSAAWLGMMRCGLFGHGVFWSEEWHGVMSYAVVMCGQVRCDAAR